MCDDRGCPMRKDCFRFTAQPLKFYQIYFSISPRELDECKYQISIAKNIRIFNEK